MNGMPGNPQKRPWSEACDADIRGSPPKETHYRINHLAFLISPPSGNQRQAQLQAKMIWEERKHSKKKLLRTQAVEMKSGKAPSNRAEKGRFGRDP